MLLLSALSCECFALRNSSISCLQRVHIRSIYKFTANGHGKKFLERLRRQRELEIFRKKIFTIPNVLTASRLASAPLFPYFLSNERPIYAFGLLFYCGVTDMVSDGDGGGVS